MNDKLLLTPEEQLEKKLVEILEEEVTIDEEVVTERLDRWDCHTGGIHEDDVTKLKFKILTLFTTFYEAKA
ncbi:hypothetical protein LCGC14_1575580, partial [marine sediment metagenome]